MTNRTIINNNKFKTLKILFAKKENNNNKDI